MLINLNKQLLIRQLITSKGGLSFNFGGSDRPNRKHINIRHLFLHSYNLATDLPNEMKAGDTLEPKGTSVFEFNDGKVIKS